MFCIRCGQQIIEGAKFCAYCGAPVVIPVPVKPVANAHNISTAEPVATPTPVQEPAPSATAAPVPVAVVPKSKPQPAAEEISENAESDADNGFNTDENEAENKEKELESTIVHTAEIPIPVVQNESCTEPISESDGSEPIPVMAASVISAPSEGEAVMTEPSNEAAPFGQQLAQSPEHPFVAVDDSEFSGYAEFPSQQSDMQQPESTPVAKNNKPHIAVAVLVSVLFGIVIFALFLGSAVLGGTKDTLSEAKLSESIKKSDPLDWVVGDIVLSDAFRNDIEDLLEDNKSQAEMDDFDEDTTLKEFVVVVAGEDKINEDQVEEIAEEIKLLDTITDVVAGYERYFLENDDKEIISTNDIEDMVEESIDVAQEVSGKTLRINTEKLDEALEANEQTIDKINPSKLLGDVGAITSVVLSSAVIIGIFVLAMILVILVGIITKRVSAAAITFGACSFAAGLVLVIVPTIAQIAIEKLGVSFELVSSFGADILGDTLFASYKQYGLLALACGAGVIIAVIAAKAVAKAAGKKKNEA